MSDSTQPHDNALPFCNTGPGSGEIEDNHSEGGNNGGNVNGDGDFDLLWSLRKYLVLLGILAVSVTYTSGLTPPGGFWSKKQDGHKAGDHVLLVEFAERHAVFFHCNSTAFAASLVLLILLLSKRLTRQKVWLRSMQVIMIVDLFSLMGAYAAGSCRALKSSIYILVLVLAVSIYICIHVLAASKWFPMFGEYQKEMEEAQKFILMLVTFSATVTYQAGLSPPGGFWAENDYLSGSSPPYKNRPATSVLRSHYIHRYNVFISCNSTSFVASLVTIILLLSPTLTKHTMKSKAVAVCVFIDLCCLIGAYAAGCCRDVATSFYVMGIIIIVLISIAFLAGIFAYGPVAEKLKKMKSYTRQFIMRRLGSSKRGRITSMTNPEHESIAAPTQDSASEHHMVRRRPSESEHHNARNQQLSYTAQGESSGECTHVHEEIATNAAAATDNASNSSQGNRQEIEKHLKKTRTCLLLLAILAVSLTYQSGLNPPGGFWSTSKNNHLVGDRILEDNNHRRFLAFFYLDAIAFVASLVMIVVLLNKIMIEKVAKRRELQICMIVNLLSLTWSFIMGSCRETKRSIFISLLLVCLVLVIFSCLVVAHARLSEKEGSSSSTTCEKDMDQRRSLILTLAILVATVTYQAGMNPPGGVWSDDGVSGIPGYPILQDTHPVRYDVFYYSNSVSFVTSVVITILLLNKESFEHGIKFYTLRICLVLDLVSLLIAYGAGSCRNWNESLFLIIVAVLVLIALVIQLLLFDMHQTSRLGTPEIPQQTVTPESPESSEDRREKIKRKRDKYLMLIAILAASVTYQAGLSPPGGFWSDDEGHVAGNPLLHDTYHRRYMIFFSFNAFSFMASIVVIMLLLSKSFRNKECRLEVLLVIMILDLLALMTAFAAGSCRKVVTSIYVFVLVAGVVIYLVIVIGLSKRVAKYLRHCKSIGRRLPGRNTATE
ncbi:hypothetical protein EJB05_25028, partial [Eragrostis curvula]